MRPLDPLELRCLLEHKVEVILSGGHVKGVSISCSKVQLLKLDAVFTKPPRIRLFSVPHDALIHCVRMRFLFAHWRTLSNVHSDQESNITH